jgi:hypothetical protein
VGVIELARFRVRLELLARERDSANLAPVALDLPALHERTNGVLGCVQICRGALDVKEPARVLPTRALDFVTDDAAQLVQQLVGEIDGQVHAGIASADLDGTYGNKAPRRGLTRLVRQVQRRHVW